MKKIGLQIVLAVIIVLLGYMVYQTINKPVEYKKIKDKRSEKVIAKLIDIRNAQDAYKTANGKYTGSFDTLEIFVEKGFIPLIKREGRLTDEMLADGINEKKAIEKGLIKIDTTKISVMDSLFNPQKRPGFDVKKMKYLPDSKTKTFEMAALELPSESGLPIPVFEAKVHLDVLLDDLRNGDFNEEYRSDTMELVRLKKFIGWKVGSLVEANDGAGNWE